MTRRSGRAPPSMHLLVWKGWGNRLDLRTVAHHRTEGGARYNRRDRVADSTVEPVDQGLLKRAAGAGPAGLTAGQARLPGRRLAGAGFFDLVLLRATRGAVRASSIARILARAQRPGRSS